MKKKEYKFPKAKAIKLQESILVDTSGVLTDPEVPGADNSVDDDGY